MNVDDQIIAQFPIIFNSETSSSPSNPSPNPFSILQFPLGIPGAGLKIPSSARIKSTACLGPSVLAKPILEMKVDMTGMPRKGKEELEDPEVDRDISISLESFFVAEKAVRYMVGCFKDGALHLTPVNILQMRPTCRFIDKKAERERDAKAGRNYDEAKETKPDYEAEAKSVMVSYRSADDKEGMKRASLVEMHRMVEQQPWKELNVHGAASTESKQNWKMLSLQNKQEDTLMDVDDTKEDEDGGRHRQTALDYMEAISTYNPTKTPAETPSQTPTSAVPYSATTSLSANSAFFPDPHGATNSNLPFYESLRLGIPLQDRVRNLLISSHAVSFTQLITLFTTTIDPQGPRTPSITTQLQPLLHALDASSHAISGVFYVHSALLYSSHARHARNVLLWQLRENKRVVRGEWAETTRMNTAMSGNMLGEVCVFDEFEGVWVGKVPDDPLFAEWFPKNQEMHSSSLDVVYRQSLDMLQNGGVGSIEVAAPLTFNLPVPLSPVKNVGEQHALQSMLVHYEIEGETPQIQAGNIVCQILKDNGCLLKSHVHEIFKHQASQDSEEGETLVKSISPSILEGIMATVCFEIRDDIVASKPDTTTEHGRFKQAVLGQFVKSDKIKKADMMEVWGRECEAKPSAALYSKIMSEYASTKKSGIWRLKWLPHEDF